MLLLQNGRGQPLASAKRSAAHVPAGPEPTITMRGLGLELGQDATVFGVGCGDLSSPDMITLDAQPVAHRVTFAGVERPPEQADLANSIRRSRQAT